MQAVGKRVNYRVMIVRGVRLAVGVLALGGLFGTFGCDGKSEAEGDRGPELEPVVDVPLGTEPRGEADPIANPAAVRGGTINLWGGPYPKTLNRWTDNNSFSAAVVGLMFEPLVALHPTEDRPIGILADRWEVSEDNMTFTFHLNPDAKWSDGKPVTAEDVQFYYDTIMDPKHLTPVFRVGMSRLDRPEVIDERTLRVTANEPHWANFWEAAGLVAFPKQAWEGKDFNTINFEFPVVSGPYALHEVKTNRYIMLKRRGDWWGRAQKFNEGKYNFDYIRYRAMEDRNKALEALKKGDFDLYPIFTALIWAQKTDFPQVRKGWVVRQEVLNQEPKGFQGLAMNLRDPKFQDRRVREALCYLLNREQMNEKLMFDSYFLLNSYFPDLFEGNRNPDARLYEYDPAKARQLLSEAGWTPDDRGILTKDGEPFRMVLLTAMPDQRHLTIYQEDLRMVGIDASIEFVSAASFTQRVQAREFDMIWAAWGASRLRDPESMWSSEEADHEGSNNITGLKDEAVDALIDRQKNELELAKRNEILAELDNRLTEIIPYVLLWQSDRHRLLYWNKFGTPETVLSRYGGYEDAVVYWWIDPEQEKALDEARRTNADLPKRPAVVKYSAE